MIDPAEKNKSLYKLKGLPHIYYINLDEQPNKRDYVERMFKYWEIEKYTRISAYDGRDDDLGEWVVASHLGLCTGVKIVAL